jgi:8-oxo-dGTP pyrophosphatase MutT (NUDIX family)
MSKEFKLLKLLIKEVLDGFGDKNAGKDGVAGNLRHGVPVLNRGGNVLTDEDKDTEKTNQSVKRAATCLIISDDGKVLAVSRRDDPGLFGLPGGKVDPGEEPIQAASRELSEETGLVAINLHPIFSCRDSGGFVTTTFACEASGQIDTDEEGVIRWVDVSVLLDPNSSPFTEYNQKLFSRLGMV